MEFNEEKEFERARDRERGGERDVRSAWTEWNAVAFTALFAAFESCGFESILFHLFSPLSRLRFSPREIKSGRNREKVRVLDSGSKGAVEEVMTRKIAGKKGGQTQKKSSERRQSKKRSLNDPIIAR